MHVYPAGKQPAITFRSFSQRGSGNAHNEDAVLLDGRVHQSSVSEHGHVGVTQPLVTPLGLSAIDGTHCVDWAVKEFKCWNPLPST